MNSEEFSNSIEQAYKEALRNADAIVSNAETIRLQAQQELDIARDKVKQVEHKAEELAILYFENRQDQFREAAQQELLRTLTRKHLETGKSVQDISLWLEVPVEFVQNINDVMKRVERIHKIKPLTALGKLRYENEGAGGSIYFENPDTTFSLWWEFAGDDAVAIVGIPTEQQWPQHTRLPLNERNAILNFIGEQVIQDQFSGQGYFIIGAGVISFYKE